MVPQLFFIPKPVVSQMQCCYLHSIPFSRECGQDRLQPFFKGCWDMPACPFSRKLCTQIHPHLEGNPFRGLNHISLWWIHFFNHLIHPKLCTYLGSYVHAEVPFLKGTVRTHTFFKVSFSRFAKMSGTSFARHAFFKAQAFFKSQAFKMQELPTFLSTLKSKS